MVVYIVKIKEIATPFSTLDSLHHFILFYTHFLHNSIDVFMQYVIQTMTEIMHIRLDQKNKSRQVFFEFGLLSITFWK